MSLECMVNQPEPVQITIEYTRSTMVAVSSNSPLVDHFLRRVKLSRSQHTWINYAHDLKVFFQTVRLPLDLVDRKICLSFMELQDQAGLSRLTINRRMACIGYLDHPFKNKHVEREKDLIPLLANTGGLL